MVAAFSYLVKRRRLTSRHQFKLIFARPERNITYLKITTSLTDAE
jgi:hypothetical protein